MKKRFEVEAFATGALVVRDVTDVETYGEIVTAGTPHQVAQHLKVIFSGMLEPAVEAPRPVAINPKVKVADA